MITLHLNFLTLCILFLSRTVTANAPVPSSDGFCASYIIQGYDTCALIARAHSITEADIEAFNTNTWAWLGCNQLYQDDFICLSTGKPPMPMALPNAVCGPQVPGTTRPANWADLASMNPCPASQCCATWGQCGIAADFCNARARKPPAGVTATVSAATEVEPMASTLATQVEVVSNALTQPGTKVEAATTANPLSKSTATAIATTTSATEDTFKVTDGVYIFPPEWTTPSEITWYSKKKCEGDYYHMEGYNKDYIAGEEGCLNLHGGLNSVFTEENVTCKWWTDGGLASTNCDSGTLEAPQSWIVKNGVCMVFNGQKCDCFDHFALSYRPEGCHNRDKRDTPKFMSFECHLDD